MLSSGLHEIDGAGDGAPEWVGRADGTGVAAAALGAGIGSAVGIGTGDGTGPGVDAGTGAEAGAAQQEDRNSSIDPCAVPPIPSRRPLPDLRNADQ